MSRASQRQEAERIKRMAKKKPKAGRVLDTIFYAMPWASRDPLNVWKAIAAWGDKRRKRYEDSEQLSAVMDEAAAIAETMESLHPQPDYYAFEGEGVYPGILLASAGTGIAAWEPMSFSAQRDREGKFGCEIDWKSMREHAEDTWDEVPAFVVRIVRLNEDIDGTVMLGYAQSGAMETRVLCRGSWISPKADDGVVAAVKEWILDRDDELPYRQGGQTMMRSIVKLLPECDRNVKVGLFGGLGAAMRDAQRPYVEVMRRLYESARSERAWSAKEIAAERGRREALEAELKEVGSKLTARSTQEQVNNQADAPTGSLGLKTKGVRDEGARMTGDERQALMARLKDIF